MVFLGTGAAECFPDPFCECSACAAAKKAEDRRQIRRRSSLLLNKSTLIDCGPDCISACNEFGKSLSELKQIFVTHSHDDHFSFSNLGVLSNSVTPLPPVTVYLSQEARDGIFETLNCLKQMPHSRVREHLEKTESLYHFEALQAYSSYQIDGMLVTPLRGNHQGFFNHENSLNYLFERNGNSLLYAADSGRFFPETMEALSEKRLDVFVIEGTMGLLNLPADSGHQCLNSLQDLFAEMLRQNTITEKTRIYLTHIGHKGKLNYYDYQEAIKMRFSLPITVAYDGMEVPVSI